MYKNYPSFFFTQKEKSDIIRILKRKYPSVLKSSIRIADQVCDRIYNYFQIEVKFKKNINWRLIPKGEIEWLCALNRHTEWPHLAKAYLYTKDKKYLYELIFLINSWIDSNPYPVKLDVSPADGRYPWELLNTANRARNWVWVYFLLLDEPLFSNGLKEKMRKSLEEHAEFLFKYYKFGPQNNWLAMEMEALLYISLMFPNFKDSKKWRKEAMNILLKNFYNNVYPDGVQFEMSLSYHTGCLRWYGEPFILGLKNNLKFPKDFIERYKKMFHFILDTMMPDGTVPAFGDTDFVMMPKKELSLGVLLFNDPFLKTQSEFDPDLLWLFGKDAFRRYSAVKPKFKNVFDYSYKKGGYYISRSDYSNKANYLIFDCGPLGGGHGHVDLLSFCFALKGEPFIIDPGRFTYMRNKWRKLFKGTSAHNTVAVDNYDQVEYISSWQYGKPPRYKFVSFKNIKDTVILKGKHYGYMRLKDPVIHTREIIFNKKSFLLIIDSFKAKKYHIYKEYFHFVPSKIVKKGGSLYITFNDEIVKMINLTEDKIFIKNGWISPSYNIKFKAPVVCVKNKINGNGFMINLFVWDNK